MDGRIKAARAHHDVVVVGGGPAGIAAAVAAARQGVSVALLERFGALGGNLTSGLVGPCMTSFDADGSTQVITGIFDEFVRRMEAMGGAIHPSRTHAGDAYAGFIVYGHDKVTPFEPEAAKFAATDLCREAGVEVSLQTAAADAELTGDRVTGVIAAEKGGIHAWPASVVIDASGDGDVAAAAGARMLHGRSSDGRTQPATLFFRVAGVDDDAVEQYVADHLDDHRPFASIVARARAEGRFPAPRRGVGLYKTLRPGVWRINTTRVLDVDGTDSKSLTAATIAGLDQARALLEFFRSDLPGFENAELFDTAATLGVRETRRLAGVETLTVDDMRRPPDSRAIAYCGYPVDIHDPTGDGGGVLEDGLLATVYGIPYGALVPERIDGLLVAGRCLSATHEALAAVRVMPPAFATGEAAGIAAAIAVRAGIPPREVSAAELRSALAAAGAYIHDTTTDTTTMRRTA
ncbi:FAD-dependent oxidoreductase [Phytohabitans kaempferiae]|uniref:FAD-dependent oxidoreductase n=1 Tax=Phytohabitans kaempferiae TaxID=1620943 RepID=A0ABV6MCE5_9ACTN